MFAFSARSREVGVAAEMLVTKAEQVSDDGGWAAGLRLKESRSDGAGGDSSRHSWSSSLTWVAFARNSSAAVAIRARV
jgi:hypothetical protein